MDLGCGVGSPMANLARQTEADFYSTKTRPMIEKMAHFPCKRFDVLSIYFRAKRNRNSIWISKSSVIILLLNHEVDSGSM